VKESGGRISLSELMILGSGRVRGLGYYKFSAKAFVWGGGSL
jgi:hypothetical protein